VLWIGGADPDGTCAVVVQELEESLGPLGFPPENRTFSIHFTLGRVNWDSSRGKLRAQLAALAPFDHALAVNELVLYESRMSPRGSTYDILSREPLDG
jgi:2'-5' RNA ligase